MRTTRWMGLVGVAVMTACGDDPVTAPRPVPPLATVYRATGPIGATVSQFRAILGPANGGIAGEQPAGRREINWDGAAAIPFNNRNDFTFADPIIARVRITLGTGALGANFADISAGGTVDVVVVDNLIYSEPRRGPGA